MYSTPSGHATVISTSPPNSAANAIVETSRNNPSGPERLELPAPVPEAVSVVVAVASTDDAVAASCSILNVKVAVVVLGSVVPCTRQNTEHWPFGSGVVT